MKQKVFFDALPLIAKRQSGIGKVTEETIRALCRDAEFLDKHELIAFLPIYKKKLFQERIGDLPITTKTIPAPNKLQEALLRSRLMPPIDLLLGKGVYVFFNYRNYPLFRSRSVTYVYDLGFIDHPQFVEEKNRNYLTKYIRRWIARTDVVVTISEYSKHRIQELLSVASNKIEIVYCGVKKTKTPGNDTVSEVLSKYSLSKGYLLYVGNIEPRKNLLGLVEGFMKTNKKIKDNHQLVIIGADGWSNDAIYASIEAARKDGCDIIVPEEFVTNEELLSIRSRAGAVITPSFYEGFSIPPLEALSQHIPIAVSNIEVHKELYKDKAIFFNPKNTDDIAKAINSVLEHPRSVDVDDFVSTFSWDAAAGRLRDIIHRLEV